MSIALTRFGEFFRAVHGGDRKPFPWQERLLRRVMGLQPDSSDGHGSGGWPQVLSLPTGSGKTTCLDVALFSLACQAELKPGSRTAPRRIIFVVDRRVIVDEAFEHACKMRDALRNAEPGILREVGDALRIVSGNGNGPALTCHQLRGGMYRDDAWARTPTQPCIICSTVDQIGSRLLFRGYGKSPKTWPMHAGLAGNDALVILDEAHCANPFFQTMQAIAGYRSGAWAEEPLAGPFHFTIMSATPPSGATDVFGFDYDSDGEDLSRCEPLRRRITARKPTKILVAKRAKGTRALEELAEELVGQAASLVTDERQRIGILVNRVKTARLIRDLLAAVHAVNSNDSSFDKKTVDIIRKKLPKEFDVVLLTGRMRPFDRDFVISSWLPHQPSNAADCGLLQWFGTAENRAPLPRPAFVVATQCLEVGANLDFDAMVSEAASLDALRQRFGRLNRIGRHSSAPGIVAVRADQTDAGEPDPVYGDRIAATWTWMKRQSTGTDGDQLEMDFGIGAIQPSLEALAEEDARALTASAEDAPVMLPAHVDCWVQTSPIPCADPDVAIFLHGPDACRAEVQVCWRADLPRKLPDGEKNAIEAVSLCAPTRMECLSVPFHTLRSWWQNDSTSGILDVELTDIDGSTTDDPETFGGPNPSKWAVIWRGPDDSSVMRSVSDVRPGDTIVVPAAIGGWESLGEVRRPNLPENSDLDIAEVSLARSQRKAVLRLNPSLIPLWVDPIKAVDDSHEGRQAISSLARLMSADLNVEEAAEPEPSEVVELLQRILNADCISESHREIVSALSREQSGKRKPKWEIHPFQGIVLRGRSLLPANELGDSDTFTTEDDSASGTVPVPLFDHCRAVGDQAFRFGISCGFSKAVSDSLRVAGELHDLGKADPRFQALLHGGNRTRADLAPVLFAKSDGLGLRRGTRAWQHAGLPNGFRHEQLSVSIIEHRPDLVPDGADRDLVLHLVGMHHGRCRPFSDLVLDDAQEELSLARFSPAGLVAQVKVLVDERAKWTALHQIDSGVAERFWRLLRRFGWWGLAWIEATFMLADHRVSEAEARHSSTEVAKDERVS